MDFNEGREPGERTTARRYPVATSPVDRLGTTRDFVAGQSVISRHWRGELPLGVSYWINGLLLSTALAVAAAVLGAVGTSQSPRLMMGMSATFSTALLPISIWQIVGIWRSAGRRKLERNALGKIAVWAALARVATVLGFISLLTNGVKYYLPNIEAQWRLAIGGDNLPHHQLRLLSGGTELELSGGIDFGTASDLKLVLEASPELKVVHLETGGGRVSEAEEIRALLSARHLATYTGSLCASACTIAYMGGNPRYLGPGAKLGFHQFSFPGLTPGQQLVANQHGEQILLAAGVTRDFVGKAFSTPSDGLWTPDAASLVAAHVVTNLSDGLAFAVTNSGRTFTSDDADAALTKRAPFSTLKKWDSATYNQIVATMVAGMQQGRKMQDLVADARTPLLAAITKFRSVAPDDVQRRSVQLVAAEARFLASDYPDECLANIYRKSVSGQVSANAHLPLDMQRQEIEFTAAVIESGASTPTSTVPTKEAANAETAQLWGRVRSRGTDLAIFNRKAETNAEQRSLCLAMAAFYEEIGALPRERAGPLLRYMNRNPG